MVQLREANSESEFGTQDMNTSQETEFGKQVGNANARFQSKLRAQIWRTRSDNKSIKLETRKERK